VFIKTQHYAFKAASIGKKLSLAKRCVFLIIRNRTFSAYRTGDSGEIPHTDRGGGRRGGSGDKIWENGIRNPRSSEMIQLKKLLPFQPAADKLTYPILILSHTQKL
jgi:hypothetical protein